MSRFLKKEKRKQERGITLIALITTIIVLLILAGISIGAITGNNGVIVNASKAKFNTEISEIEEQIELKEINENNGEEFTFGTLENILGRTDEYNEILSLEDGELVYEEGKVSDTQKEWLEELGIFAKKNAIPIYTKEHLQKMGTGEKIKIEEAGGIEYTFSDKGYYILQNNINLQGDWQVINAFNGTLEGKNYCISGISGSSAIINRNNGTIQNLKVEGNLEKTGNYIGGIVNTNNANAKIINCENNVSIKGYEFVGGIAGINNSGGTIENCINNAYLAANSTAGGIVGNNSGNVKRCANLHEIKLADFSIGGVVGINNGTVEECYNIGNILATTGYARYAKGGVVGRNSGIIKKCYNTAKVDGSNNWNVGGIAGDNRDGAEISFCYNIGEIIGGPSGGIVGENIGDIKNCYTIDSKEVFGASSGTSEKCLKLTEEQMKNNESIIIDDLTTNLIKLLNEEEAIFEEDSENINNGFPVFKAE